MITATDSVVEYTGDNKTLEFAIPFAFMKRTDIIVQINEDVVSEYFIVGGGNNTGSATFYSAPLTNAKVKITRNTELTQTDEYVGGTRLPVGTLETSLDKLTMIAQDVNRQTADKVVNRLKAVKLDPEIDENPDLNIKQTVNARKNKIIGFNDDGDIEIKDITAQADVISFFLVENIIATSTTLEINAVTTTIMNSGDYVFAKCFYAGTDVFVKNSNNLNHTSFQKYGVRSGLIITGLSSSTDYEIEVHSVINGVTTISSNRPVVKTLDWDAPTSTTLWVDHLPSTEDTAVATVGGFIYTFNNLDRTILKINPATRAVTTLAVKTPIASGDKGWKSPAVAVIGSRIYLFGGWADSLLYKGIVFFDTDTETISVYADNAVQDAGAGYIYKPSINLPTMLSHNAVVSGTDIYLYGGFYTNSGDSPKHTDIIKYDTILNTFTIEKGLNGNAKPAMASISANSGILVGNFIYAIGTEYPQGIHGNPVVYKYDINTQIVETTSIVLENIDGTYTASTLAGNHIYYIGGLWQTQLVNVIQTLNIENETVSQIGNNPLNSKLSRAAAVFIGKTIYIRGGSTTTGVSYDRIEELQVIKP